MNNPIYGFIGRLGSAPSLIAPQAALAAVIRESLGLKEANPTEQYMQAVALQFGGRYDSGKLYAQLGDAAIIPVHGLLINRSMYSYSSLTGYNYIEAAAAQAEADSGVRRVIYDIASFGGEAQGCFETVESIRAMPNRKPSMAMVTNACSAAYALATVADKIVASPSSYSGSVGVVTMHADFSKMLDDWGVKITLLYAGSHKVDGNPFEALPETVREDIMSNLEALYSRFAQVVGVNRKMSVEAVKGTEARVYRAEDALKIGFIDKIEAPQTAIASFISGQSGISMEIMMDPKIEHEPDAAATAAADQAAADKAAAEKKQADEKAAADAADAAAAATAAQGDAAKVERVRVQSILGCDEAKGRSAMAKHLAFGTSMSVDEAKKMLSVAALEVKAGVDSPFHAAMDKEGGAGVKVEDEESGDKTPAARMLGNYTKATGRKLTA